MVRVRLRRVKVTVGLNVRTSMVVVRVMVPRCACIGSDCLGDCRNSTVPVGHVEDAVCDVGDALVRSESNPACVVGNVSAVYAEGRTSGKTEVCSSYRGVGASERVAGVDSKADGTSCGLGSGAGGNGLGAYGADSYAGDTDVAG